MSRWFFLGSAFCLFLTAGATAQDRLRVIMETDAGGDPDDQASLVRFLLYANEWDVEGLIADRPRTSNWPLDKPGSGLELVRRYVDAYGHVYKNLRKHSSAYPTHHQLYQRTVAGYNEVDDGVKLIIQAADRDDPRPIWYGNWGSNSGSRSNLRRAFDQVKATRSRAEYQKFVQKFRICTLDGSQRTKQGHDDLIKLHIETGYPTMDGGRWYHRFGLLPRWAKDFDVQRDVKRGHGPLGAIYTIVKEGDSWTFLYLIPTGLNDPYHPTWGSWAGRYGLRRARVSGTKEKQDSHWGNAFYWANQRDTWRGETNRDNTARRWADHIQNDFKARLDWCVADKFAEANHEPVPHCQGDGSWKVLEVKGRAGSAYQLSAAGSSDPDGDELSFRWYVYPEPGTYRGKVKIDKATAKRATLRMPADAAGKTIHVILEVTDDGEPPLTRYRRIIVTGR
jgi:hypothetical protein